MARGEDALEQRFDRRQIGLPERHRRRPEDAAVAPLACGQRALELDVEVAHFALFELALAEVVVQHRHLALAERNRQHVEPARALRVARVAHAAHALTRPAVGHALVHACGPARTVAEEPGGERLAQRLAVQRVEIDSDLLRGLGVRVHEAEDRAGPGTPNERS